MTAPESEADTGGDAPIDFRDYRFRVREAAVLSRVPEATIRNWDNRMSGLNIGRRIVFRRVRFCLADVVHLHVMFYLAVRLGITRDTAAKVGALAAEMSCLPGSKLGNAILLGFDDDGQVSFGTAFIREPGHYMPPSFAQDAESVLRRPHIMIPVDSITHDVVARMDALTKQTQPSSEETTDADE